MSFQKKKAYCMPSVLLLHHSECLWRFTRTCLQSIYGSISKFVLNPFTPRAQKVHSPNLLKIKCISEVVRIDSVIIFHLCKRWKVKFFILCGVTFIVRLQGKFEIDHSWE